MKPSTAGSPAASVSPFVRRLSRLRVPLGFAGSLCVAVLASPTWTSLAWGALVAALGEAIRMWASGHLEKGREVTQSGPYRWCAHPLYLGSSVIAVGLVIAASSWWVALVAAAYMGTTIPAAIRSEEAELRAAFGDRYDAYRRGASTRVARSFSPARAWRNREYRSVVGLVVGLAVLALKSAFGL